MSSYANQVVLELGDFSGWDFADAGTEGAEQFFEELGKLTTKGAKGARVDFLSQLN